MVINNPSDDLMVLMLSKFFVIQYEDATITAELSRIGILLPNGF